MVTVPLIAGVLHTVFGILMFVVALFLILLVLVQRGRGGGLAGALGGMGGQSAFGARAGDTFTYVTIWASAVWILMCIAGVKLLSTQPGKLGAGTPASTTPSTEGEPPGGGSVGQPDAEGSDRPQPGSADPGVEATPGDAVSPDGGPGGGNGPGDGASPVGSAPGDSG